MGCATGLVKYLVFLFNLIFTLIGLALVIIATIFRVNVAHASKADINVNDFGLANILTVVIIIGAIIFVTSFLGCCGAIKENPCMLNSYAVILLTIFLIQLATGIYAVLKTDDVEHQIQTLRERLTFGLASLNDTKAIESRDFVQTWFECCGVNGPEDYGVNKPDSCCASKLCPSISKDFFSEGCANKLHYYVDINLKVVGGVALGTAVIEILGAILGFCLANSIGKIHYRKHLDPL